MYLTGIGVQIKDGTLFIFCKYSTKWPQALTNPITGACRASVEFRAWGNLEHYVEGIWALTTFYKDGVGARCLAQVPLNTLRTFNGFSGSLTGQVVMRLLPLHRSHNQPQVTSEQTPSHHQRLHFCALWAHWETSNVYSIHFSTHGSATEVALLAYLPKN